MLAAVVFGRIVGHDFQANWDDYWFVINNQAVRGFSLEHLRSAFSSYIIGSYVPLQTISFMLDYSIWGLAPGGFLLTNVILHAVNGVLVYRLLITFHAERLLALVGSALFLVHPVQVESVAWISNRKSLLAMLFFLLAWDAYHRYFRGETGRRWWYYTASLMAFSLALLAKSIAVVFPVVLILYETCFPAKGRRLYLRDKIPFVLAAGAIAVVSLVSQSEPGGARVPYHGGSPLATAYTMLTVYCRYLGMLFWPTGLSAYYAPTIHRNPDPAVIGSLLLLGGLVVAGVWMYRYDHRLGFWILFALIGFLPVSQIVPMQCIMADRYLYLPMIGAGAVVGYGIVLLRQRSGKYRSLLYSILILSLLMLSSFSFQRAGAWRDSLTLWSDAVAKEPNSDKAWEVVAGAYVDAGRKSEARQAYERGLALNPSNTELLSGLGDLYTEAGQLGQGYALLRRLLDIKPTYVTGWASLGNNYLKGKRFVEAEQAYQRAQELQPEAIQVVKLLANLAFVQGYYDQAGKYYELAEAKGEGDPESAYRLACAKSWGGRNDDALLWLEKALQRGYQDVAALDGDQLLAGVRKDPRFNDLIDKYLAR
jgi:tetratricopeptide (TPR) repeat protein